MMNKTELYKGIGIGMAVGAVVGAAASIPMKKKGCKAMLRRMMRTVGEVVSDAADNMGM